MEAGRMKFLTKRAVIEAPSDRVLTYVNDPTTMVDWIPHMMEIRDVIGTGEGLQYGWTCKYVGLLLTGQSVVVEYVPNEFSVHQTIGTINSILTLRVEPHEERTRLTLDVEYEIPIPVLGKLAEHLIVRRDARDLKVMMSNVKEFLEG
jgi:carbon monoxide dehydrogenase subunit G